LFQQTTPKFVFTRDAVPFEHLDDRRFILLEFHPALVLADSFGPFAQGLGLSWSLYQDLCWEQLRQYPRGLGGFSGPFLE